MNEKYPWSFLTHSVDSQRFRFTDEDMHCESKTYHSTFVRSVATVSRHMIIMIIIIIVTYFEAGDMAHRIHEQIHRQT